jgi:CubicO group peptidase (beta-lactamase class C family)
MIALGAQEDWIPVAISRKLALLAALATCGFQLAFGQIAPAGRVPVEEHIQHIRSGLIGGTVLSGQEHATHTLADRMKALNVPGVSIAVIHAGKIEWAQGFGVRELGGAPVNAETMFQAGSISKPVAAMAALKLVQDRELSLDTDVNTYLKSWRVPSDAIAGGKPATLRELLTHTAGMTVHGFEGYASDEPVPTLVQVLNGEKPANSAPIRSEQAPGKEWKYSGGGYTIMQQALIDVAKEPFPKILHDSVLVPIGMTRSTYEQPLPQVLQENAARPYRGDGKPVQGGAHTYPEMAAAGLWTTPTDLAKYAIEVEQSLVGKANHVLNLEMTRQMLTPGMGDWGLGLHIGGSEGMRYFSHDGANEGFRNVFVAYEKSGEGAVVMTNSDNGSELADEVMHSVAAEYGWPDWKPTVRTAIKVDEKILEQYAGTYQLKPGLDLVATVENGQLNLQATDQPKFPVYAETETKFFPLVFPAEIEFMRDTRGKVTALTLHQGGHDTRAPRK